LAAFQRHDVQQPDAEMRDVASERGELREFGAIQADGDRSEKGTAGRRSRFGVVLGPGLVEHAIDGVSDSLRAARSLHPGVRKRRFGHRTRPSKEVKEKTRRVAAGNRKYRSKTTARTARRDLIRLSPPATLPAQGFATEKRLTSRPVFAGPEPPIRAEDNSGTGRSPGRPPRRAARAIPSTATLAARPAAPGLCRPGPP